MKRREEQMPGLAGGYVVKSIGEHFKRRDREGEGGPLVQDKELSDF